MAYYMNLINIKRLKQGENFQDSLMGTCENQ